MVKIAAVILETKDGKFVLYLRDNKSNIPFPNYWDLFGGHVEEGESPQEALRREVKEELGIELGKFSLFKKYVVMRGDAYPNEKYIYQSILDIPYEELRLGDEGEKLGLFSKEEIPSLKLANILKDILLEYLASRE